MKHLLAAVVVLVVGAAAVLTGAPAGAATLRLGGVAVALPAGTTQVVTVNHTGGHRATVTLWHTSDGSTWERVLSTRSGTVGYGGMVPADQRRQGSGMTPTGTFRLTSAFGTHRAKPGWDLPYRTLRPGDYWVGDNASPHYNRFRTRRQGGFRWWLPQSHHDASERLLDYRRQYEYAMTTSFNAEQVRDRGFAIFLHVNGPGATAGCVGVPRPVMRTLMRKVDPERRPVIAIGP